jgi:hypothetical protein
MGAIFSPKKSNTIRNKSIEKRSKLAGEGFLTFLPKQDGNNGEKLQRIHINPVDLHGPVKMRSADPSACAAQSDLLACCNLLAGNDLNFAQVGIIGKDAHAVVNDHDIAGIKKVFGQSDDSGIGCIHGGADICSKISASVVACMLTVK